MRKKILSLIEKVSTTLPNDVLIALKSAFKEESEGSPAKAALEDILKSVALSKQNSIPICQDTGTAIFYVRHPASLPQDYIEDKIIRAVKLAVKKGFLRPNAVNSITGENSGDGVGDGNPQIHFTQSSRKDVKISLLLKGGGSENVSAQYSLPDNALNAHRNLDGVRRCVMDAVFKAQGLGCAPGIIGVGIGGDRGSSYLIAKEQLFRRLMDINPVKKLRDLEDDLLEDLNQLGIGPMGVGGKTTVLGVKIGTLCRVPASFFVSISYICWATRRGETHIKM